jgi:phosphatidylserine decarboxylase
MAVPFLTPFGRREILLYGGSSLGLLVAIPLAARLAGHPGLAALAVLPALLLAFTLQFFRDPERAVPGVGPDAVLSPADGTVADIVDVDEPEFLGCRARRIGIFMSPFNCHVNRFPVDGTVAKVVHRAGKFLAAYDPRAVTENEASITGIATRVGGREARIMVRQVSGVAARRIVNPLALGARAVRGERFGMIKFGSRCELFFPLDAGLALKVQVGDRVYAGVTVLADAPARSGAGAAPLAAAAAGEEARS